MLLQQYREQSAQEVTLHYNHNSYILLYKTAEPETIHYQKLAKKTLGYLNKLISQQWNHQKLVQAKLKKLISSKYQSESKHNQLFKHPNMLLNTTGGCIHTLYSSQYWNPFN